MKAKVIKTGEILEVMDYDDSTVTVYRDDETEFFAQNKYPRDELEFLPDEEEAVIEGYAVRWRDGDVTVFQQEPVRYVKEDGNFFYGGSDSCKLFLSKESLPFVTIENSPQKVKITITPIE